MSNFSEDSRRNWNSRGTIEDINAGSLQRIAAAVEVMSKRYSEILADRDRYERWYKNESTKNRNLQRTISALRGQITKLKNKHEKLPAVMSA